MKISFYLNQFPITKTLKAVIVTLPYKNNYVQNPCIVKADVFWLSLCFF